jgi:phage terminase large subunit-like protein
VGRPGQLTAPDKAVRFINNLTHTKGKFAREKFNLREWQEHVIVRPLFSVNQDTGLRQYRTCLLMLPRKNGKSELAAAVALYGLMGDGEIGAEVYSAAADRDQASLVFNVAAEMVRTDPYLDSVCEIVDSQKRIIHRKSGSVYRAISSEAYTKHGFNASMVIADELHAWPNRELWDVLTTSMGAREQPLVFAISTAGYDRHSILYELYAHACKVREGSVSDPSFLPVLYEAPQDADWTDERTWHVANPALGDFRSLEEMRIMAARAKSIPAQENTFRRLYLNQWTEQAERWIPMPLWDACRASVIPSLVRRRCFVGMDLSTTRDLTAIVAVFPIEDGTFVVLPHFFVPKDSIRERANRDRVPYEQWERDGYLTATPGAVVDYEYIRLKLQEWSKKYDVKEIAYDPYNATDLVTRLSEQDGFTCVQMRQGMLSLSAPTKALEKYIVAKQLQHDGHPVLRWNVANAAVEQDAAGNMKLSKKVSTERIDGAVALVMAVDRMERNAVVQDATLMEWL